LFVAPVTTEMLDAKEVNLPPGEWYDFWTGSKPATHDHLQLHPRLEELPLYVRAGAILPMQPLVQSTSETPAGPLKLRVYPGDDCRGTLYMDDGHTYAYQKNEFLRVEYTCQLAGNSVSINGKTVNGAYHPWWNSAEVTVYGAVAAPKEARVGDQIVRDFKYDSQLHSVTLTVPDAVKDWSVRLSY
jgi:alpha-glucosidase